MCDGDAATSLQGAVRASEAVEVSRVGIVSCRHRGRGWVHGGAGVGTILLLSILAKGSAAWQVLDPCPTPRPHSWWLGAPCAMWAHPCHWLLRGKVCLGMWMAPLQLLVGFNPVLLLLTPFCLRFPRLGHALVV